MVGRVRRKEGCCCCCRRGEKKRWVSKVPFSAILSLFLSRPSSFTPLFLYLKPVPAGKWLLHPIGLAARNWNPSEIYLTWFFSLASWEFKLKLLVNANTKLGCWGPRRCIDFAGHKDSLEKINMFKNGKNLIFAAIGTAVYSRKHFVESETRTKKKRKCRKFIIARLSIHLSIHRAS